jgi:hypothetical protein
MQRLSIGHCDDSEGLKMGVRGTETQMAPLTIQLNLNDKDIDRSCTENLPHVFLLDPRSKDHP